MSSTLESKENDFALKVIRVLDENTSNIPAAAVDRLAQARRSGIARKKPEKVAVAAPAFTPVLGGAGATLSMGGGDTSEKRSLFARLGDLGLVWPLAALVIGIGGIAYWEDQQRKAELADIDAAMLSDSLPLDAYLDHGFNAYLSRDH
ncbi:putative transmembrane protein [Candidatus Burkholderia humilis]|nr:putative transmembrane protein [Candidatus Burkholderia humilis]